jgi:hypothetical protein
MDKRHTYTHELIRMNAGQYIEELLHGTKRLIPVNKRMHTNTRTEQNTLASGMYTKHTCQTCLHAYKRNFNVHMHA